MRERLPFIQSLYGGFWNFSVQDFNYLVNPYFPPEEFMDIIKTEFGNLVRSYPSTNWYISRLCNVFTGLTEEQLVVANGASELISSVTQRYVHNIAVPVPTFDEYVNRAEFQGKQVSLFQMPDGFNLDVNEFVSHVEKTGANAALIINPNNPTGAFIPKNLVMELLEHFRGLDLVIVDESFIDFSFQGDKGSVQNEIGEYNNLLIIKSLSKSYGIPGLRLGYAASGNKDLVQELRNELPIWSINSLAQFFLEHIGDYLNDFADSCRETRVATEFLYKGLCRIPYLNTYPTEGNYVLCRLLNEYTSVDLVSSLFNHSGILINDCSRKRGLDDRFVRIASRTLEENRELLDVMGQLVEGFSTIKISE